MKDDTVYYRDPVRPFLNLGFDYRGHQVRYESFESRYDACIMTQVIIDGTHYPYAHRTQGGAEAAAKRIIDRYIDPPTGSNAPIEASRGLSEAPEWNP
jgi:hypothetical protein